MSPSAFDNLRKTAPPTAFFVHPGHHSFRSHLFLSDSASPSTPLPPLNYSAVEKTLGYCLERGYCITAMLCPAGPVEIFTGLENIN